MPASTPADRPWWSPFRVIGGISVIHVDLRPEPDCESRAIAWLDESEIERCRRFKVERPRREFALCRAALRANLCSLLDCTNDRLSFGTLEHGKPFALVADRAASISFNVSHSGARGLIAFASQGRLGVDAEVCRQDRDFDGIAERVFGSEERASVAAAGGRAKVRLFYRLWAMKESLIKALGTGFSLDPSSFEIPSAMIHRVNSGIFRFPHLPADTWRLECLGIAGFSAALAWEVVADDRKAGDRTARTTDSR